MPNEYQYKFHLKDKDELLEKLQRIGIELTPPVNYMYTYFKPPRRIKSSFAVIRVKESDKERTIDMKIRNNKTEEWERYESKIDNPAQVTKILETIGCKAMVIFRKSRQTFINQFLRLDMDTYKGLGVFLEVKFKISNKKNVESFLRQIGVDPVKHDRRSIVEIYFLKQKSLL